MKQYEAATLKKISDLLKESFERLSDEYYVYKNQRNDLEVDLNILLSEKNKSKAGESNEDFLSPRKNDKKKDDSIDNEITAIKNKLNELNKKIKEMNEKRNEINDSIEFYEELLTDMVESDLVIRPNAKKKSMKVVKKDSPFSTFEDNTNYQITSSDLGKLDHIAKTFSNVSSYTKFDPNRACIELSNISKEMNTIISSAKKI